jgi:hypothetical protein
VNGHIVEDCPRPGWQWNGKRPRVIGICESGSNMAWAKRDEAQTIVVFKMEHSAAHPRANELLSRFLATDLTGEEFLRQSDKLSDPELRLLRELLIQRSISLCAKSV